jgi:geranylgeranyl reductase family protein
MEKYDVLVVGAGPAGSTCAKTIAKKSDKSVLLIEKREVPKSSGSCGIFMHHIKRMEKFGLKMPQNIVQRKIKKLTFHSPSNSWTVDAKYLEDLDLTGEMIDRKKLDPWLIKEATASGAEYRNNTDFLKIKDEIKAKIYVDASGPSCVVGKMRGLDTKMESDDYRIAIQYTIDLPDWVDSDTVHFYIDTERVPGAYLWVAPIAEARCEAGVSATKDRNAKIRVVKTLNTFLTDLGFKIDKIYKKDGGIVPVTKYLKSTQPDLFLIGDAGRYCPPATGMGTYYAIKSGRIAGEVIANVGDVRLFNKLVKEDMGRSLNLQYRFKKALCSFNNEEFDRIFSLLQDYNPKNLGIKKGAKQALPYLLKKKPVFFLRLALKLLFS